MSYYDCSSFESFINDIFGFESENIPRSNYTIKDFEDILNKYYDEGSHGQPHIIRVYNSCGHIISRLPKKEVLNIDIDVVKFSAILHDISRPDQSKNKNIDHAIHGAERVRKMKFDKLTHSQIEHVADCIATHRYSGRVKPQTIEAMILSDADRLDVVGAIGIVRAIQYATEHDSPFYDPKLKPKKIYKGGASSVINHLIEKTSKIDTDKFYTIPAKEMVLDNNKFVQEFIERSINSFRTVKGF